MNILPGASRQQLAIILDLRQKIRFHNSFMKPKDKDLIVCINPNDKVLSKIELIVVEHTRKTRVIFLDVFLVHELRKTEDRRILEIKCFLRRNSLFS